MKKAWSILLALACLALCACGGQSAESAAQPAEQPQSGPAQTAELEPAAQEDESFGPYRSVDELLAILNGEADDPDLSMPQTQVPEADADGAAADYAGGASEGVFSDEGWTEGTVEYVQFDLSTEEGAAPAGGWGGSELTAGLPEPPGGVSQAMEDGGSFFAMANLADEAEFDDYVAAVKAAGFSVSPESEDLSAYGMDMKTYCAAHADGRYLTLTKSGPSLSVEIDP